jgi:hypothetical protein
MVDIIISAALAALTIVMAYLGVHVTLHPPNESQRARSLYKAGFFMCGILAVALVILQGVRTSKGQRDSATQIANLRTDIQGAKTEAQNARSESSNARMEVQNESSRRQQAEKDLLIALQATGKATRQGVAEDIRKTPLHVEVNGQPIQDTAEAEAEKKRRVEIRTKLGEFLNKSTAIKNICLTEFPAGSPRYPCLQITNGWLQECYGYIQKNMEPSYAPRFAAAGGLSLSYNAAHGDQEIDNSVNTLTFKAAALNEFIREMH